METAKQYLIDHPNCMQLFVDENMGWHYVKQGAFTTPVSRDEILNEKSKSKKDKE